ncbi:LysR family transcriptional regulator [Corynebacterium sp. A21]|uniref:LysR family transcriptional regulator n=1 Tax=Corynebacterium sp. A21 TaxID=3457318 RepID=UPI003FCF1B88
MALESRLLEAFLSIVEEGTISRAATVLHISQPALSRQLRELEKQAGQQLIIRSNKQIELTAAGRLMQTRARDILNLIHRTEIELSQPNRELAGHIWIGAAESAAFRLIARAMSTMQQTYPNVQFSVLSGNGDYVSSAIEDGTLTFGVFIEPWDLSDYESILLPDRDRWGLLVRAETALAHQTSVSAAELRDIPLLAPDRVVRTDGVSNWLGTGRVGMNLKASYNLLFNAVLMVEQGVGSALCIDGLVDVTRNPAVAFIPLDPPLYSRLHLAWKQDRRLSPTEKCFLDLVRAELEEGSKVEHHP